MHRSTSRISAYFVKIQLAQFTLQIRISASIYDAYQSLLCVDQRDQRDFCRTSLNCSIIAVIKQLLSSLVAFFLSEPARNLKERFAVNLLIVRNQFKICVSVCEQQAGFILATMEHTSLPNTFLAKNMCFCRRITLCFHNPIVRYTNIICCFR